MARVGLLSGLILLPLLSFACGDGRSSDDGRIQVVTTLPLFADFVRNIGGDRVDVTSLLPLGADPHTFEPSPRDVEPITEADIAFANGLGLEPGLINVLEANLRDGVELVKLGERVKEEGSLIGDDPHLWMNPLLAHLYSTTVRFELAELDPEGDLAYEQGWDQFAQAIGELSSYVTRQTETIPLDGRKLVTTHEAFTHFGEAFGLEVAAVAVESPGQEPSPQDIANLRAAIEREGVPAVFTEPQISEESKILEQAAEDAGVRVCTLYSDSLDDRVTTYIEMMRFNVEELVRCLGGDDGG